MRDSENRTCEAEQGSAANSAFLRRRTIPAQEMLLCNFPWQLDWYREEKEATAREAVSGQSAERLRTCRAERTGTTSPAQPPSLERERGGPAGSGRAGGW